MHTKYIFIFFIVIFTSCRGNKRVPLTEHAYTEAGVILANTMSMSFEVSPLETYSIKFGGLTNDRRFSTKTNTRQPLIIEKTQGQEKINVEASYTIDGTKMLDILLIVDNTGATALAPIKNKLLPLLTSFDSSTNWQIKVIPSIPPGVDVPMSITLEGHQVPFKACGLNTKSFLFSGTGPVLAASDTFKNFSATLDAIIASTPIKSRARSGNAPIYSAFLGLTCDITSGIIDSTSADFWLRPYSNIALLFVTEINDCQNLAVENKCSFDANSALISVYNANSVILGSNIGTSKTPTGLQKLLQSPLPASMNRGDSIRSFSTTDPLTLHAKAYGILTLTGGQAGFLLSTETSTPSGLIPDSGGALVSSKNTDYDDVLTGLVSNLNPHIINTLFLKDMLATSIAPAACANHLLVNCPPLLNPDPTSIVLSPSYLEYDNQGKAIDISSVQAGQKVSINYQVGSNPRFDKIELQGAPDLKTLKLTVENVGGAEAELWKIEEDFTHVFQNNSHLIIFDKKTVPDLAKVRISYKLNIAVDPNYTLPENPKKINKVSVAGQDVAETSYLRNGKLITFRPALEEDKVLEVFYTSEAVFTDSNVRVEIGAAFASVDVQTERRCPDLAWTNDESSVTITCPSNPNIEGTLIVSPAVTDHPFPMPDNFNGLAKYYDIECYLTERDLTSEEWIADDNFLTLKASVIINIRKKTSLTCDGNVKQIYRKNRK